MPEDNANTVKLNAKDRTTFFGTTQHGHAVLRCGDCGRTMSADEAEDHVCPARGAIALADGGEAQGTYHVVCHDCDFEEIIDDENAPTGSPERDAGYAWNNHKSETGHDVERAQIMTDGGINFHRDLTGFQQDILYVLRRIERGMTTESTAYGLAIKRELETLREVDEVNHGRLYPNLDQLVEMGLVEKEMVDRRTNEYATTETGRDLVDDHARWAVDSVADQVRVTDGGVDQ